VIKGALEYGYAALCLWEHGLKSARLPGKEVWHTHWTVGHGVKLFF